MMLSTKDVLSNKVTINFGETNENAFGNVINWIVLLFSIC